MTLYNGVLVYKNKTLAVNDTHGGLTRQRVYIKARDSMKQLNTQSDNKLFMTILMCLKGIMFPILF